MEVATRSVEKNYEEFGQSEMIAVARRFEALRAYAQAILRAGTVEEMGRETLRALQDLVAFDQGSVSLFDFDRRQAQVVAARVDGKTFASPDTRVPLESIGSLASLQRGESRLVTGDLEERGSSEATTAIRSYLVVPVLAGEELLGSINVGARASGAFDQEKESLLRQVAETLGLGLRRSFRETAMKKRTGDLEFRMAQRSVGIEQEYRRRSALAELELAINRPKELEGVLDRIVEITTQLLPATGGASVILWDPAAEEFYIRSSTVPGGDAHTVFERIRREEGSTRWIVDHREPLIVPDVDDSVHGTTKMLAELGYRAYAGVPLLVEGDILGVLYAVDELPRPYTEDDVEFLNSLANRAAVAVSKVQLYERIREANRQLENKSRDLEAANRELRDFAHIISHDLKAPLRGIRSIAQWLIQDYAEPLDEGGREMLETLAGRVERMHDLIDGVLAYARAGHVEEDRTTVDLQSLVMEVVDSLSPLNGIEVTIVHPLPIIRGHRARLMQVFQNLIGNAVRYMDDPTGRVEVGHEDAGAHWRFFVRDNGPGIPPENHERIFQPFQTADGEAMEGSSGVGLSVVKRIVESEGGQIRVESSPGSGSTFHFTLPKSEARG